mmetsp:Transcript_26641/g.47932  ORF Transcript_26641/g.47932 Transcript_26641/m.47932 type:complete len:639 (+) Transcript_26641:22-1938(+)
MYRVSISVPEASAHGECVFLLANQVASLVVPSTKGVIIESQHLKPGLTLRCIFKLPQGLSARIDLILGDLFPELTGSIDSWFELEPSASTPRNFKRTSFSKELRPSTAESSPTTKPELRLVVNIYRVEQQTVQTISTEICPRCGALSKIVASQQEEINQLKERLNSRSSPMPSQPSLLNRSVKSEGSDDDLAALLKGSLGSINSKWDSLQAIHKEVERLRTRLNSPNTPSNMRFSDYDIRGTTDTDDTDKPALERTWSSKSLREGDVQSELESLRGMLASIEAEKQSMYDRMHTYLAEIKDRQLQAETTRTSFDRERHSLKTSIEQLKDEVSRRDLEVEQYHNMNTSLERELEDYRIALTEREKEIDRLQDVEHFLKESENSREQMTVLFTDQLERLEEKLDCLQKENAKIREDNAELVKSVKSLKLQLEVKHNQVIELENIRTDTNSRLEELERQLRCKEDGRLQEDLQRYLSLTDQLQQQLLQEMDSLKRRVQSQPAPAPEIKPRVIYEAIKGDEIDSNLAEYLNAKEPPVPVPFRREEPGVYFFGTKKVFIKIEQGKIIIRVGGGFMTIDEFIDIYTPIELEKQSMPREAPTRERLISKIMSSIDESSDYVTCVGLQRKSVSPSRRSARASKSPA